MLINRTTGLKSFWKANFQIMMEHTLMPALWTWCDEAQEAVVLAGSRLQNCSMLNFACHQMFMIFILSKASSQAFFSYFYLKSKFKFCRRKGGPEEMPLCKFSKHNLFSPGRFGFRCHTALLILMFSDSSISLKCSSVSQLSRKLPLLAHRGEIVAFRQKYLTAQQNTWQSNMITGTPKYCRLFALIFFLFFFSFFFVGLSEMFSPRQTLHFDSKPGTRAAAHCKMSSLGLPPWLHFTANLANLRVHEAFHSYEAIRRLWNGKWKQQFRLNEHLGPSQSTLFGSPVKMTDPSPPPTNITQVDASTR